MTHEVITTERQRELIARLTKLVERRASEGVEADQRDRQRTEQAQRQYQRLREEATLDFQNRHAAAIEEYKAAAEKTHSRYESQGHSLAAEESRGYAKAAQELADSIADAKTLRQHRIHEILRAYREQKVVPRNEYAAFKQQCLASAGEVNGLVIKGAEHRPPPVPVARGRRTFAAARVGIDEAAAPGSIFRRAGRAYQRLIELQNQPAARFVEDGWPVLIFIASMLIALAASWWFLLGTMGWPGVAIGSLLASLALALVSRQARGLCPPPDAADCAGLSAGDRRRRHSLAVTRWPRPRRRRQHAHSANPLNARCRSGRRQG